MDHPTPDWPAAPATPDDATHVDHPTSLAMPTFAASMQASPQSIGGGVAQPADPADPTLLTADVTPSDLVDPTGQWWSPGIALVLACAALAWQLVSFYARVQLPLVEQSQAALTNFDRVVGGLPLADSAIGQVLGVVLAAAALAIVLVGVRRGLREPALQVTIGSIAGFSVLAMVLLPSVAGR